MRFKDKGNDARELRRRADELDRRGGGIPHNVVRGKWLAKMERELREMARNYDGEPHRAPKLLEALIIARKEGLHVDSIMATLARKHRRNAA